MKNSNSKFNPLFYKEIKIDMERNQLIKFNLIKDVFKVTNLCEIRIKSGGSSFTNNNTNLYLNTDLKSQSLLLSFPNEECERIKLEAFLKINPLIQNENYANNLNDHITNILEEKLLKIFEETESKLFEQIVNYSNEMERALYEEKTLSIKLEKLTEYYEHNSIY